MAKVRGSVRILRGSRCPCRQQVLAASFQETGRHAPNWRLNAPRKNGVDHEYAADKNSKAALHQLVFEYEERNSLRRHRAQAFPQGLETVVSQNRTWLVQSS